MTTVLCDCESVLNSRPLTFIAEGDSEAIPITPSMFIQDIRESGMPELDVIESVDLKKTVQRRLKLKENFRDRFRNEYLGQLQMRSRTTKHDKLKIGDVVLIGNDGTKRIDWPLARVIELLPGKDGTTRLVRLQTTSGTGTCLRPIQRLYPFLEVDISTSEDDSSGANLLRKMSQDRPELLSRAVPQPDRDSCSDDDPPEPQDRIKKTASGRTIIKPLRFCD
ncbi:unnamed protein product [Nesidiocoris tenuis]|uniref:DUF5641 domain-containing protein n=1 Tax=Nesidiocoris tenuis TaxID=355587 RepID=A0A6H5HRJ2_9HEMI|nr:unnamed protein product [Nesidiocoris tenuis]CAB0019180.1 unnamed protein product [Nesidiocoris tenuis]CAB0019188.1 unnamed protein product [Nesidiocoris tenuis]